VKFCAGYRVFEGVRPGFFRPYLYQPHITFANSIRPCISCYDVATICCLLHRKGSILVWQPNAVIASGPPIYLPGLTLEKQERALHRSLQLAKEVDTLILDHHLMRSKKGEQWLDSLSSLSGHKAICAADFMGRRRRLLEAERVLGYEKVPVPEGWHEAYARDELDTKPYQRFFDAQGF
jgi:hypothetical protein